MGGTNPSKRSRDRREGPARLDDDGLHGLVISPALVMDLTMSVLPSFYGHSMGNMMVKVNDLGLTMGVNQWIWVPFSDQALYASGELVGGVRRSGRPSC
jgi:hypothetical protein